MWQPDVRVSTTGRQTGTGHRLQEADRCQFDNRVYTIEVLYSCFNQHFDFGDDMRGTGEVCSWREARESDINTGWKLCAGLEYLIISPCDLRQTKPVLFSWCQFEWSMFYRGFKWQLSLSYFGKREKCEFRRCTIVHFSSWKCVGLFNQFFLPLKVLYFVFQHI